MREPNDLKQLEQYAPHVDALLLDAWSADQLGGTGTGSTLIGWPKPSFRCRGGWQGE